MKYVRTKDGIFEVVLTSPLDFVRIDKGDGTYPDVFEKDILKQANTIKELCDELVVIETKNEDCSSPYVLKCFYLYCYNSWFEREKEHIKNGTTVVYGEIWIDGELHKVAKMNEKGELKLL